MRKILCWLGLHKWEIHKVRNHPKKHKETIIFYCKWCPARKKIKKRI